MERDKIDKLLNLADQLELLGNCEYDYLDVEECKLPEFLVLVSELVKTIYE